MKPLVTIIYKSDGIEYGYITCPSCGKYIINYRSSDILSYKWLSKYPCDRCGEKYEDGFDFVFQKG